MAAKGSTAWLNGLGQKLAIAGAIQSPTSQGWNFVSGAAAVYNQDTGFWDITLSGGGGSGHTIQDEGVSLTARTILNFVGPNVTVTDVGGKTVVTVPLINLVTGVTGSLSIGQVGAGFVKVDGSTALTGDQSFGGHKATNVADAGGANDAPNLAQVNALIAAAVSVVADWKQSVRAATTAALPANTRVSNVLTANTNGALAAQDGVTLIVGDRLLAKDEATGANRGIYTVTSVGSGGAPWSLTRATDSDTSAEVTTGLTVVVEEGAVNGSKPFILTTANPITINTTALTFTGLASVVAGNGLTGAAALAVLANGATINVSSSGIKVADASIGGTQLTPVIAPLATAGAALALARMNAAGTATEYFSPPNPVAGTDLPNSNVSENISNGSQRTLQAGTLSASTKTLTLGTGGTPEVDEVIEVIVYSQSQNYVLANGGPLADTLYTVIAGTKRVLHAKWNGTDWRPAGKIRLT